MKITFFLKTILIQIAFCFSLITATQAHHDARRFREHAYSSLYWFIITSIMYYKTQQDYPLSSALFGLIALHNGINMLHYYHESLCAAHVAQLGVASHILINKKTLEEIKVEIIP